MKNVNVGHNVEDASSTLAGVIKPLEKKRNLDRGEMQETRIMEVEDGCFVWLPTSAQNVPRGRERHPIPMDQRIRRYSDWWGLVVVA